jgi:hypothetical protein
MSSGAKGRRKPNSEEVVEKEPKKDPRQIEIEAECKELEKYRDRALQIAENGDPLEYLLDTFGKFHVNDKDAAKVQFIAFACQACSSSQGLQVVWIGPSGKGKSAGVDACYHLIPKMYVLKGSVTAKSLFRHDDLPDSACIFLDDIKVEEGTELEATIKRSTSAFQEGAYHEFLDKNQQLQRTRLPRRLCWSVTYVDIVDCGDQFLDRMFVVKTDSSRDADEAVCEHILRRAEEGEEALPITDEVMICKALWLDIKNRPPYKVKIPNIMKKVEFTDRRNRRNPSIFIDIVRGLTCLRHRQRKMEEKNGVQILYAEIEDLKDAAKIFNAQGDYLSSRLDDTERAAAMLLAESGSRGLIIKELADKLRARSPDDGWNEKKARRLLLGRQEKGSGSGGLAGKLPGLYSEEVPQEDKYGNTRGLRPKKVYKLPEDVCTLTLFGLQVKIKDYCGEKSETEAPPNSPYVPQAKGEKQIAINEPTMLSFTPITPESSAYNPDNEPAQISGQDLGEIGKNGKLTSKNESKDSEITNSPPKSTNGEKGEKLSIAEQLARTEMHRLVRAEKFKTPAAGRSDAAHVELPSKDKTEPEQASKGLYDKDEDACRQDPAVRLKEALEQNEAQGKPVVPSVIADELGIPLREVTRLIGAQGYAMTQEIDPASHMTIYKRSSIDSKCPDTKQSTNKRLDQQMKCESCGSDLTAKAYGERNGKFCCLSPGCFYPERDVEADA